MTSIKGLALALLLAGGCTQEVAIVDDVDVVLDFTPQIGPSDSLHSPYVQGASMNLYVQTAKTADTHLWTIESADPTLFAVSNVAHTEDDQGHWTFSASGLAVKEGTVDLIIRDGHGAIQHRRAVQVMLPDRVELMAHGPLLIGRPDVEADVNEARVQSGGTATYLARYWRGAQQLNGNGALTVQATPASWVNVESTYLFENRDWLQVSPDAVGASTAALLVGGVHVADLPLVAVPASDVSAIAIHGEDESHARKGDWLVALAQANDANGNLIDGVEYNWTLDDLPQEGLGDLYRYQYNPQQPHVLVAGMGAMTASVIIHGAGYVDSTNNVGCSFAPHAAPPASAALLFVLGIGFLVAARRRLR